MEQTKQSKAKQTELSQTEWMKIWIEILALESIEMGKKYINVIQICPMHHKLTQLMCLNNRFIVSLSAHW